MKEKDIKETSGIKYDRYAEIKTGDKVYFEGTFYGLQHDTLPGTYTLGVWDAYYGFILYDINGKKHDRCDSTRVNTFKII